MSTCRLHADRFGECLQAPQSWNDWRLFKTGRPLGRICTWLPNIKQIINFKVTHRSFSVPYENYNRSPILCRLYNRIFMHNHIQHSPRVWEAFQTHFKDCILTQCRLSVFWTITFIVIVTNYKIIAHTLLDRHVKLLYSDHCCSYFRKLLTSCDNNGLSVMVNELKATGTQSISVVEQSDLCKLSTSARKHIFIIKNLAIWIIKLFHDDSLYEFLKSVYSLWIKFQNTVTRRVTINIKCNINQSILMIIEILYEQCTHVLLNN